MTTIRLRKATNAASMARMYASVTIPYKHQRMPPMQCIRKQHKLRSFVLACCIILYICGTVAAILNELAIRESKIDARLMFVYLLVHGAHT